VAGSVFVGLPPPFLRVAQVRSHKVSPSHSTRLDLLQDPTRKRTYAALKTGSLIVNAVSQASTAISHHLLSD
jgi:hypothetical protein